MSNICERDIAVTSESLTSCLHLSPDQIVLLGRKPLLLTPPVRVECEMGFETLSESNVPIVSYPTHRTIRLYSGDRLIATAPTFRPVRDESGNAIGVRFRKNQTTLIS